MKKVIPVLVAVFILIATLSVVPFASASSSSGSGQSRVVTFSDPFQNTNMTVTVPNTMNNETNNSFAYLVMDESTSSVNYTFNMTFNGTNAGTVDIVSVSDDNITGYINYTADAIPLTEDSNVTITMLFTDNWTQADVWYGETDVVDASRYSMRITLIEMIVALMSVAIIVLLFSAISGSIGKATKGKKKK